MSEKSIGNRVDIAGREIARILSDLERDIGVEVSRVDIVDIDVTTVSDEVQKWRRSIVISLMRMPGTAWDK